MDAYTDKENAKARLNCALSDYIDTAAAFDMAEKEIFDEITDILFDMGYNVEIIQN